MKTLVIMPTYNEIESLQETVGALRAQQLKIDLLIVDDASPDGTGQLADKLKNETTFVLHREAKNGLGAAYLAGFDWAFANDYEVVVEMDADGSHQATDLEKLLTEISTKKFDLVIGSRWVAGGAVLNWPAYRKAVSKLGNLYARIMLRTKIHDMTAGFRAYRVSFLKSLDLSGVAAKGYAFQVEMALRTVRAGGRVAEVPITFIERAHGNSKMTTAIVLEALWLVTKWGFYRSA